MTNTANNSTINTVIAKYHAFTLTQPDGPGDQFRLYTTDLAYFYNDWQLLPTQHGWETLFNIAGTNLTKLLVLDDLGNTNQAQQLLETTAEELNTIFHTDNPFTMLLHVLHAQRAQTTQPEPTS